MSMEASDNKSAEKPVSVQTSAQPVAKKVDDKIVTVKPGEATDKYRGQGGAYKINADGHRVPDTD